MSKIVIAGTTHPYRGGLASFNERLAREFQQEGHEVVIHTFTLQYPKMLFPGKTQYTSEPAPEGLTIHRTINSINPFNWGLAASKILKDKPDLVIMKYWIPFVAMSLGRIARKLRKKGARVISIADNIIPHEKRLGDKAFTRYFVNSVDGFIVMSSQVENDLKQFSPDKPCIFNPHPLFDNFGEAVPKEEARKMLKLDPEKPLALFFGIIRDYKGLDILLKAFDRYAVRQLPLNLLVAGEFYTDAAPYHQLIKGKSLENKIILHDHFIPDSEVYKYFCAADVVVQPYKSATQSGVTQIAYHFDKPMIVTGVGGLPELIPNGIVGYVVEPDPVEIADAIATFYIQHKEQEFVENIRREKEKFSWKKMVGSIFKLANDI